MFQIEVETEFAAAHAILIRGEPEPLHGHNWHVTVTLAGPTLDPDGLLCDFHLIERSLLDITRGMHNRNLNELPAFTTGTGGLNPSAENVAVHIAQRMDAALKGALPISVRITRVRVTEAPGCAATYYPASQRHPSDDQSPPS